MKANDADKAVGSDFAFLIFCFFFIKEKENTKHFIRNQKVMPDSDFQPLQVITAARALK